MPKLIISCLISSLSFFLGFRGSVPEWIRSKYWKKMRQTGNKGESPCNKQNWKKEKLAIAITANTVTKITTKTTTKQEQNNINKHRISGAAFPRLVSRARFVRLIYRNRYNCVWCICSKVLSYFASSSFFFFVLFLLAAAADFGEFFFCSFITSLETKTSH